MYQYEDVKKKTLEYFDNDELATDVWIDKYALRDNDGSLMEDDPSMMHRRLSKEFARIESKYPNPMSEEEIYGLLEGFKYIVPQGSPMSAIGNDYQYQSLSNCFVKGTQIYTEHGGVINIEDAKIGDRIITHRGRYKEISQIHENDLGGRTVYDFKCYKTPNTQVTENHEFWSITKEQIEWGESPQWNSVGKLRKGDYVAIPNYSYPESIDCAIRALDISVLEYPDKYSLDVGEYKVTMVTNYSNHLGTKCKQRHKKSVNKIWRINNDFAFFLGLWYGDGCIFSDHDVLRGITFTFGSHERVSLVDFVVRHGEKMFGLKADVNDNSHIDGTIQVVFHSHLVAQVFNQLFGRGCGGKKMVERVNGWNDEMVMNLFGGLISSDGTVTKVGDVRVVLHNEGLIKSFYHLGRSRGMLLGISNSGKTWRIDWPKNHGIIDYVTKEYTDNRVKIARDAKSSRLYFIEIDGVKFVQVTGKSKAQIDDEKVYTIGVNGDHSYSVEGLICKNCFVVAPPKDSYGGICYTDQQMIQLMKRRGGVGFDISNIRPKDMGVLNAAKTTDGISCFMERYSNSTREVAQKGRRGALMLTIDVRHPEIETFINIKRDLKKVTGANISIKVTDDFMSAAVADKPYVLRWPVNAQEDSEAKIMKTVMARSIWDKIIDSAHSMAEPGILFWDNVRNQSPADVYEGYESTSTNPCFGPNEFLLTDQGYKTFEELEGLGEITIINKDGDTAKSRVWKSGKKEVITLKNSLGEETVCTPNHVWMTNDGKEVKAQHLKGKRLMPFVSPTPLYDQSKHIVKLGFIQGDGNLSRLDDNLHPGHRGFEINIGEKDDDILDLFGFRREDGDDGRSFYTSEFYENCKGCGFSEKTLPYRTLPKQYCNFSKSGKSAFLRGLYSANGCIIKGHRIAFKSTCLTLILQLQETLEKDFGISAYYTTNKSKKIKFYNGEYECRESYDLNISRFNGCVNFNNEIGFVHKHKQIDLKDLIIKKSPVITKMIWTTRDVVDVYDFTEPKTHWGVVNGYIAHNCGEVPLSNYDSCRLLLLNLMGYVVNPYTKNAMFDFGLFHKHVIKAQRLMDDMVDLELEKIDKIRKKLMKDPEHSDIKKIEFDLWLKIRNSCEMGRRTGLGVTAVGDVVAAMGLRYGSQAGNTFVENVYRALGCSSYASSIIMAKERGAFPSYDEKIDRSKFVDRILSQYFNNDMYAGIEEMYREYGRRNIANLTTAPCGSVSMLTQTSSGIEPVFKTTYKRRKRIQPSSMNGKVDCVDDMGDAWEEYVVHHRGYADWLAYSGEGDTNPYNGATAGEIHWKERVDLQRRAQKWIDHAISSTCNLPEDATKETVNNIYMEAWTSGCKGFTVYRDKCRSGVLVDVDDGLPEIERNEVLPCNIHSARVDKEDWTILVGMKDKAPFEIFAGHSEFIEISKKHENGEIYKVNRKTKANRYDLHVGNGDGFKIKDIVSVFNNPTHGSFCRMISALLRYGAPIQYIVEQLRKDKDTPMNSFNKVIARVLEKYVDDGEESEELCSSCGMKSLVYQEGCKKCLSCGVAACG